MRHINREFTRPIICLSWIKRSCISVPLYDAIFLNHQIRILLHRSSHAASELCYRRHFIFKGDRCFLHIIPIYANQLGRIVQPCCSYRNFTHDKSLQSFLSSTYLQLFYITIGYIPMWYRFLIGRFTLQNLPNLFVIHFT